MARVPYPKLEDLPQAERPIYERMVRERGGGHIWLALANAPKILDPSCRWRARCATTPCSRSAFASSACVMVGLVTKSAYEFDHHWNAALAAGVRREQLENLAQFETSPHFDDKERAVLRYAKEATETGVVSDASWDALRRHFDTQQAMEVVLTVAWYNCVVRILLPLEIEHEPDSSATENRGREPWKEPARQAAGRVIEDGAILIEKDVIVPLIDGHSSRATSSAPTAPGNFRRSSRSRPTARTPTSRSTSSATGISCCATIPTWCRASPRGKYLTWEVPDPERWMPAGYAIVVVDARGTGKSPGYYELMSALQTRDVYDVIEWAGVQPWSNGKVGMLGVSYLAIKQWQVAALQPPHLAAMIPWEGMFDHYRDFFRHGGIFSSFFMKLLWDSQIAVNQNGNGASPIATASPASARPARRSIRWCCRATCPTCSRPGCSIGSTMPISRRARRGRSGSRCRSSRPATGAGSACICAAM